MILRYTWYTALVVVLVAALAGVWVAGNLLTFWLPDASLSWEAVRGLGALLGFPAAATVALLGARRQSLERSLSLGLLAIVICIVYGLGLYVCCAAPD